MALLDNILMWTEEKLPLWQRDAARRLFQQETGLSVDDYAELYALLKSAYGLPNPLGLTPEPLKAIHLPTVLQAAEKVVLKAIRDLVHVNRIAAGQKLDFAPSGMTVIYGGNGSGKSGYVRVMKRHAVHAIGQRKSIQMQTILLPKIAYLMPFSTLNGICKSVSWAFNACYFRGSKQRASCRLCCPAAQGYPTAS